MVASLSKVVYHILLPALLVVNVARTVYSKSLVRGSRLTGHTHAPHSSFVRAGAGLCHTYTCGLARCLQVAVLPLPFFAIVQVLLCTVLARLMNG